MPSDRKSLLLRLDPAVYDALARWASDDLRSTNAQIEFLLREALRDRGRLPSDVGEMRRRGRPRSTDPADTVAEPPANTVAEPPANTVTEPPPDAEDESREPEDHDAVA